MTGNGSKWNNTSKINIGFNGDGTLTIRDGGSVNISDDVAVSYHGKGTINVVGSNSNLTTSAEVAIGYGCGGEGTLTIRDGGTVSARRSYICAGSTVEVSGKGSVWTHRRGVDAPELSEARLIVGSYGKGNKLTINNQESVSNIYGTIGDSGKNASGTVEVSGSGSTWNNERFLLVGSEGEGTLIINNNAEVRAANITVVAYEKSAVGMLKISSGGTLRTRSLFGGAGTILGVTFDRGSSSFL